MEDDEKNICEVAGILYRFLHILGMIYNPRHRHQSQPFWIETLLI